MRIKRWTTNRVAGALKVPARTIWRLGKEGFAKPFKIGSLLIWCKEDVQIICAYLGREWNEVSNLFPGLKPRDNFAQAPSFTLEDVADLVLHQEGPLPEACVSSPAIEKV
jgi:hypothetical protein